MNVGNVVKCIYEFTAEGDGDLTISPGDLIKITKVVNNDWCEGICNGKKGQFPTVFVEQSNEMFDVGIAISTFEAQQDGDLSLLQGEFVVISEKMDDNWYSGYTHGGSKGIFPVNFIQLIDFNGSTSLTDSTIENRDQSDAASADNSAVDVSDTWYDVIESFTAADSSELDLTKGTSVKVLSHVDDFWCHGENSEGQQGIFPKSFINIENDTSSTFTESNNDFVNSKDDVILQETLTENLPNNEPEVEASSLTPISKARALYTFQGTEKGDLSFVEGDEIFILEKIDSSWYKGQNGADIGIFPSNYVTLYEETNQSNYTDKKVVAEVPQDVPQPEQPTNAVKKKKPPGRPKPPTIKKDRVDLQPPQIKPMQQPKPVVAKPPPPKPEPFKPPPPKSVDQSKPFSYYFTTESQPTVIIPSHYSKPGFPNIVVFRKNAEEVSANSIPESTASNHTTQAMKKDNQIKNSYDQFSLNASDMFQKTSSSVKDERQRLKTKGNVIGNEIKSINKNIPNDDMSTFQKMKSANNNLNSVVKISNEVGIKTTKKEVLTNAAKLGVAGYATGSKANKPALPTKSFKLK